MRLIDADALTPDTDYDDGDFWAFSKTQIENAPTIEPERKKGTWIRDPKSNRWRCSKCYAFALRTDHREECLSDYCSCCGAYMKGEQNEQT